VVDKTNRYLQYTVLWSAYHSTVCVFICIFINILANSPDPEFRLELIYSLNGNLSALLWFMLSFYSGFENYNYY
jgi:hypothetical protein